MLPILTNVKRGMIPILTPIMKDGETTLILGIALSLIQRSRQPSSQDRTNFLLEQVLKKMDDRFQGMETTLKQVQERQATNTIVSNLQAQLQNRLPSQPYPNPKENVSAMTLRSGKELKEPTKKREVEPEK